MPELRLDNSIVDERYKVDLCLSRGSYSEIFLASDLQRNREQIIIKALNTSLQGTIDADLERTLIQNFQNEAIALDKVCHPNIIKRMGHGTAADLMGTPFHYLVLEYMPGGDLLSLCRTRPLCLNDALFYFNQVADALSQAHSQQVIHRDIKPTNLLLTADRRTLKIADFGVAKIAPGDECEITRVGTNVYAAPEHHPDSQSSEEERLTRWRRRYTPR
jgi:serine/threonine protein kinase